MFNLFKASQKLILFSMYIKCGCKHTIYPYLYLCIYCFGVKKCQNCTNLLLLSGLSLSLSCSLIYGKSKFFVFCTPCLGSRFMAVLSRLSAMCALTSLQTLNHHQHIASLSSSSSLTSLLSAVSFDFAADYRYNWANILIIFAAASSSRSRFGAQNKAIKRVPPSYAEDEGRERLGGLKTLPKKRIEWVKRTREISRR